MVAKPDNILVGEDGDLFLVDFAGGATDGCVDWKLMDTLKGDLQASPRTEEFGRRKIRKGSNQVDFGNIRKVS
jgi:hypothetical protein